MAYIKTYKCDENIPNFLASEIGLITKTRQLKQEQYIRQMMVRQRV